MVFELIKSFNSFNKKFKTSQTHFVFQSRNEIENFLDSSFHFLSLFQDIYRDFIEPQPSNFLIRLVVEHGSFDYPISERLMRKSDFKLNEFMNLFDNVRQSRKRQTQNEIAPNHKLRVTLQIVEPVEGRGLKRKASDMQDFCSNFLGAVRPIQNIDNLCLVRAILIGKAIVDKENHWNNLERPRSKEMIFRVSQIVKILNLPTNTWLGLEHVALIDNYLDQHYQITVFSAERDTPPLYYNSSKTLLKDVKFINILFHDAHFYTIYSMRQFYNCCYFCDFCKKRFDHLGKYFLFFL